ncbi:MAG: nucleoside diphosphate kinase regulator [Desulfoplanes sp.]|nr:nucleoside diphosphate kinase regulator [Desulfoplanes sp.]MDD4650118.1 nucleoside diphosphate kinase regulator [Desulfoplanes sp.]
MKQRQIFITAFDKKRLDELIAVARAFGEHVRDDLDDLAEELGRANVVEPTEVPANVVTMNSKVILHDLHTSEDVTYVLVFPNEADVSSGAISVLAPIGTAILGYREGDSVEWPVPAGIRQIRIEKVLYQPEAAGDFDR